MTTPTLKEKRFCEKNGINFVDIDIDDLYRAMRESDREKWKAYSKQYYQQNSEQVKTAMQKHRELHRDDILEKRKSYAQQDFVCECGCTIKRNNLSTHLKTKKHQDAMKLQNIQN